MSLVKKAPESWSKSEKQDYRQAAWTNVLREAAKGALAGSKYGWGGAIAGAFIGGTLGGVEGAQERKGMRESKTAETQAELAAASSSRTQQASTAAAQKSGKRAGPKDPLAGQNLDVLAGNMPSPGNSPSSGTGYDFIRSEYGWG